MSVAFKINAKLLNAADIEKKFHLEPGGLAQQTLEKRVVDYSVKYCPFDTGMLAVSPYTATAWGSGQIVYPGPYAHYLYYGQVYGPNIPVFEDDSGVPTRFFSKPGQKKHPTGKFLTFKTDQNPLAGPFWVERMWADHSKDIIEEVRHAAGIK